MNVETDPIIDCYVHEDWATQHELAEYLPTSWREWVGNRAIAIRSPYDGPVGQSEPPAGNYAVSAAVQSLESISYTQRPDVATEVLIPGSALYLPAYNNPRLAAVLTSAVNDWTIDRWLSQGEHASRLGSILVANQWPEEAVREIHRVGTHPRMVQVLFSANGLAKPYGHPAYYPIYEAAAELGLPIAIHVGGDAPADVLSQTAAVTQPATVAEYRVLAVQTFMTHSLSLIAQGVFERLPGLRVMLLGGSIGWIVPTLWRYDLEYLAFGRDVPWLRRKPSEYFVDHFKVTTSEMERDREVLAATFSALPEFENLLCFGTTYPRSDSRTIDEMRAVLPASWLKAVLYENAADFYGTRLASTQI
jgi:predicted TIM-barrel fold metal-dependent hydrolase